MQLFLHRIPNLSSSTARRLFRVSWISEWRFGAVTYTHWLIVWATTKECFNMVLSISATGDYGIHGIYETFKYSKQLKWRASKILGLVWFKFWLLKLCICWMGNRVKRWRAFKIYTYDLDFLSGSATKERNYPRQLPPQRDFGLLTRLLNYHSATLVSFDSQ